MILQQIEGTYPWVLQNIPEPVSSNVSWIGFFLDCRILEESDSTIAFTLALGSYIKGGTVCFFSGFPMFFPVSQQWRAAL